MSTTPCPECADGDLAGLDVDGSPIVITCPLCSGTREVSAYVARDWLWDREIDALADRFERGAR